jgi:hypothetical protein
MCPTNLNDRETQVNADSQRISSGLAAQRRGNVSTLPRSFPPVRVRAPPLNLFSLRLNCSPGVLHLLNLGDVEAPPLVWWRRLAQPSDLLDPPISGSARDPKPRVTDGPCMASGQSTHSVAKSANYRAYPVNRPVQCCLGDDATPPVLRLVEISADRSYRRTSTNGPWGTDLIKRSL